MLDYKPNIVLSNQEFKVVGIRPIRHDGWDKVTGRARYGADIQLPGMLHGKILRSPHAHARIKRIDYSKALQMPGVMAVATAADLPDLSAKLADQEEGSFSNYGFRTRNILAREKAFYRGHAIAGVAATSPHIAEEALSLIEVEYEVLQPVLTALDAMKEDAPILHEMLVPRSSPGFGPSGLGDVPTEKGTNVANHFEIRLGDVQRVSESTLRTQRYYLRQCKYMILDLSDIQKRYAHKMSGLGLVYDGSEKKTGPGCDWR